jgi:putative rhamnosyltransferase
MQNEFVHLVITRFNTAVSFAPSAQRLDTDWLRARLIPFDQYCRPSVVGQKGAKFRWIIFLDAESPVWFKERIESTSPLVKVIYVEGPLTDEKIASGVAGTGLVHTPYLLTTRVDSDDALAHGHLAAVQKVFRHQDREFLVFPFGVQSYCGHLYNAYWPSNPFLSLTEKVRPGNRFTTVYCVRHDRVRQAGKVKRIYGSPQWLQIIHNQNSLSVLRGVPRLSSRSHSNFDVRWPEAAERDSLATRFGLSLGAYRAWMRRLVRKATGKLRQPARPSHSGA